jgi:hypothetical protein
MDVMSEQPKEELEEPFEPVTDPRFANETPEERKARGQRALATLMRIRAEGGLHLDIDIDELRGRKHS